MFSPSVEAEICLECLEKLEEYDRICLQAARIQEDIANIFKDNQAKIQDDQNDFLKCQTCFAQCSSLDKLSTHECIIEDDEEFDVIEYAEYSSDSAEIVIESPQKSATKIESFNYTCNICSQRFERRRNYQSHIKMAHLPENAEIFHCSQCNDGFFASENELKLHIVVTHPADLTSVSTYECPICSKAFTTKALLNRHFGIHSSDSERPHICEICGKTYFHYSSFRAHVKIHTDIRDYSCSQCDKTFRSQSHLNRHLKIHTKQKDHECRSELKFVLFKDIF